MARSSRSESPWLNRAFHALSDPMRREIIEIIQRHPVMTVNELCERFPVSRFVVMRHLNALEDGEIVVRVREGKEKQLFVDQESLLALKGGWLQKMTNLSGDHDDEDRK